MQVRLSVMGVSLVANGLINDSPFCLSPHFITAPIAIAAAVPRTVNC